MENKQLATIGKAKASVKKFVDDMLDLDTLDKCTYVYNNAENYYEAQKETVVSIIRGKALVQAKLRIVGESSLLYVPMYKLPTHIKDEWFKWLRTIKGTRILTNPTTRELQGGQIDFLFKFMEVYETTQQLTGNIIAIPNGGQYNNISNALGRKQGAIKIIEHYDFLAREYNKGEPFKSEKLMSEALKTHILKLEEAKAKVTKDLEVEITEENKDTIIELATEELGGSDVGARDHKIERVVNEDKEAKLKEAFIEKYPQYEKSKKVLNIHGDVIVDFSDISKDSFKLFVKEVSKVIHSDKGGNDELQKVLNALRDAVKESNVFPAKEAVAFNAERTEAFRVFVGDDKEVFGEREVSVWI